MFTVLVPETQAQEFSRLLGTKLLTAEVLDGKTDRARYFRSSHQCGHLFLDPDTGLWMKPTRPERPPSYVLGSELVSLSLERPDSLTLVFDQSLAHGKEVGEMKAKLSELKKRKVHSFAYFSHVGFILASAEKRLVDEGLQRILSESSLLERRIIRPR